MSKKEAKASEEFWRVIIGSGSLVIDCEYCGRTYFATESEGIYEEGELEDLREKAKKNPEQYIEDTGYDNISWGYLEGKQVVYRCSKECEERVAKIEGFILTHRYMIAEYLNERAKKIVAGAKRDAGMSTIENVK